MEFIVISILSLSEAPTFGTALKSFHSLAEDVPIGERGESLAFSMRMKAGERGPSNVAEELVPPPVNIVPT